MTGNSIVHRPTDCGLAVTFPLSYRSFRAAYDRPGGPFFPRHYGDEQCVPGSSVWTVWRAFAPCGAEIRRTCRRVAELGVTVRTAATLDDVRCLFATCRVVTLFSHSPFLTFDPEDLLDAVAIAEALDGRAAEEPRTAAGVFRRAAAREWQTYCSQQKLNSGRLDSARLREALCACFNGLIERDADHVFDPPADRCTRVSPQGGEEGPLVWFARANFEIAFPARVIRPATTVDFADKAVAIRDLQGLIAAGFQGVADLGVCHSSLVGEYLKAQEGARCVVIVNRGRVKIRERTFLYRHTMELLAEEDAQLDYVSANYEVRRYVLRREGHQPTR